MVGELNLNYPLALKLLKYALQILFCNSWIIKKATAFACTLHNHLYSKSPVKVSRFED